MTLDDFRDYVLFKLLDAKMSGNCTHIAVDSDGTLNGYVGKPQQIKPLTNSGWWDEDEYSQECIITIPIRGGGYKVPTITIPDNIKWQDCVWKI